MHTLPPLNTPPPRRHASGLFHKETVFMFEDFPERYITIGRGSRCHIRSDSRYVSSVHALLELIDGVRYLANKSSLEYTFVDGLKVTEPTPLWVGNMIVLGNCQFVAVDENGKFPISTYGITELCCKAADICGGQRPAGRYLDKHHSYVKRRIEKGLR